jgi:hypothetical protein
MEARFQYEREARAARNHALFRAVNEQVAALNAAFAEVTDTFAIACECADSTCVQMLSIEPDAYERVRETPRHFAVLKGHASPVDTVVSEADGYVVVESEGLVSVVAAEVAAAD